METEIKDDKHVFGEGTTTKASYVYDSEVYLDNA